MTRRTPKSTRTATLFPYTTLFRSIPFTVIERQGDIGGTWALNTSPEIRVDTSSYLYQFKFEKNFRWTDYYASGDETQEYLDYVAAKLGVRDTFEHNRTVHSARWDEAGSCWRVDRKSVGQGKRVTVRLNLGGR